MAAVKRSLNVGMIGIGNMGLPILRSLAFKSRSALYLQVHSRDMEHATKVADDIAQDGAQCALRLHNKYTTLTKWCDVVISCVGGADAGRAVMLERSDALLPNARPGQIIVNHTTLDVDTARECGSVARQRGAWYLDAPLSGSPQAAHNGQLTVMVGAEEEPYMKVLALLRLYAENVHRMGDVGSGSAAKCICQNLVAAHTVAAAEALTMATDLGIQDHQKLFNVLDSTWGSSTMLRRNGPLMERLVRTPESIPDATASTVGALLDDLDLAAVSTAAAAPPGQDPQHLPLFQKTHRLFARTAQAGVADRDIASVVHFLESDGRAAAPKPDPVAAVPLENPAVGGDDVEFY